MPIFKLGMNAKIYQGVGATALGSLTVMDNVRDVTLNCDADEADVSSRANSGWKGVAAALRSGSVDFELLWKTADPGFIAIRNTYLGANTAPYQSTLELAILDGERGTSGVEGLKGRFSIISFSRSEPLTGAITVTVTAKLTEFDRWVEE